MPTHPPFTPIPRASHARLTPKVQRAFIAALEKLRYAAGAEGFRAAWDEARASDSARRARRAARGASRVSPDLGWPDLRLVETPDVVSGSPDASCRVPEPHRQEREPNLRPDEVPEPHQQKWEPVLRPDEVTRSGDFSGSEKKLRCRSNRPSRRTSYLAFAADPPDADDPLLGFAPYVHAQPRRNSITPDRQRAFIAALAATASVTQAAREIGASLEALYRLRARGGAEGFAKAWDKAVDCGMARLEDTALIRAMEGELRPVVSGGKVIAHYRRHNDALAMFMLRHRRAHRYGSEIERRVEVEYDHDEIIASINRKIDTMRERMGYGATVDGEPRKTPAEG
ncbi:MAG TPA: hypothetical protein VHN58_08510 [Croceicoccus sp.]|nr:hypothetical protein [Croceicoccus sp.]